MKKLIIILSVALLAAGCITTTSTQVLTFRKVTLGMSKAEVRSILGAPERLLSFNSTAYGVQEVFQYRTIHNEVYALEFWNDRLIASDFLYEEVYVPRPAPPTHPFYGHPIFPNYRPPVQAKPPKPAAPSKPKPPTQPSRPPVNRPNNNNNSLSRPERPTNTQPSRPSEPSRPSDNNRPGNVPERPSRPSEVSRPSETVRPSDNSGQESNDNSTPSRPSRPTR